MESEFDANRVQTRNAEQIAREQEDRKRKEDEAEKQHRQANFNQGQRSAEEIRREIEEIRNRQNGVGTEEDKDKKEENVRGVEGNISPEEQANLQARETVLAQFNERERLRKLRKSRTETEQELLAILKDCGADSMQQIRGMERLRNLIWPTESVDDLVDKEPVRP